MPGDKDKDEKKAADTKEETKVAEKETETKNKEAAKEPKAKDDKTDEKKATEDKPDASKAKDTIPDASKVKDTKPDDSKAKETKSDDTKAKEVKPDDSKAKEVKPDDSKAKDAKPDGSKAKDSKPDDSKAKDTKPDESKSKDTKSDDSKLKDTKSDDSKAKDTKPDDSKIKESKKDAKSEEVKAKEESKPPAKETPTKKTTEEDSAKPAKDKTEPEKNGLPVDKPPANEEEAKKKAETPNEEKSTSTKIDLESKATEETPLTSTGLANMYQGLNGRLVFAVAAAALGSAFQHGYNLGVINAPLQLMGDWLNTTSYNRSEEYLTETGKTVIISWVVSIYCIGGMLGGAFTGFFSERFGRKGGLMLNNIFALVAAVFFGFCKMANSWEMIIIGRFVIGINNGLNAGLAPMYLSEIAPINLRGAIGTVYQLVVTISILFSQIMGLDSCLGTESLWPILLALTAVPAIFQLLTLPICPESPKFLLINKEQKLEAQRALSWLRDTTNVEEELEEFTNEAEAQKLVPKVSIREICSNPALRIPLVISLMMMMAQQLSGINAAIFFSVKIYEAAGLNEDESLYATIAMGTMNVLMTVVSLILVERAGRKTLMLTGLAGMAIDTVLLTLCLALQSPEARWLSYASIVLVILFVVMFATGPGSIPWFIVNELFASNARPTACSIAVAVNWTAAFIVGIGFLPIQQALGPYVFLVFTLLLSLFILFVWKKVPETKGRSIDEITAIFKQQAYGGVGNRV